MRLMKPERGRAREEYEREFELPLALEKKEDAERE